MPSEREIRRAIKTLSENPDAIRRIISADERDRRNEIEKVLGEEFTRDLDREDVKETLREMMVGPPGRGPTRLRPVEWAGVLATLAAGALAA